MIARIVLIASLAASSHVAAEPACKAPLASADDFARCTAACDRKRYDACAVLGLAYAGAGGDQLPRAVALLEKSCKGGAALGCGGLGSLYMGGIGVTRDPDKAVKLFGDACKRGDGLSCESLGGWYAGAMPGTKPDPARAAPWYERACSLDRPAACAFLASFILDGIKVPNGDKQRVPGLFEKACRGDVNVACKFLGDLYNEGKLVRRDVKQANVLYARACKLGYDRGCTSKAE